MPVTTKVLPSPEAITRLVKVNVVVLNKDAPRTAASAVKLGAPAKNFAPALTLTRSAKMSRMKTSGAVKITVTMMMLLMMKNLTLI